MAKVTITFPQITIESRIVEVTSDQLEYLTEDASELEKTEFIWNNITEKERTWTDGEKWIESSIEMGYCGIKKESK